MNTTPAPVVSKQYDLTQFNSALLAMEKAPAFAKARCRSTFLAASAGLLDSVWGVNALYLRAGRMVAAGLFAGTSWEFPERLQPTLVRRSLLLQDETSVLEALSELRFLHLAAGSQHASTPAAGHARDFLLRTAALNLDLLPMDSAAARAGLGDRYEQRARRVFSRIQAEGVLDELSTYVAHELQSLVVQRSLDARGLRLLAQQAAHWAEASAPPVAHPLLDCVKQALAGPTSTSRLFPSAAAYEAALQSAPTSLLAEEGVAFARSLAETGIAHGLYGVVLRQLAHRSPRAVPAALGLNARGQAEFEAHSLLVLQLLTHASSTNQVLGLVGLLESARLADAEVRFGLQQLLITPLHPTIDTCLTMAVGAEWGGDPRSQLLSGAVAVLGQPLGISQGERDSCQAARAINVWSQRSPAKLLSHLVQVAGSGSLTLTFEGEAWTLPAAELSRRPEHLAPDPVSALLVPPLDAYYRQAFQRACGRNQDPHRWVNPEMLGACIPVGFTSALDASGLHCVNLAQTIRRFYRSYHPDFCAQRGHGLVIPVGLLVTDAHGRLLGPHAVVLQRVATDGGAVRAYFFNPNRDGRQNWGLGVCPTVCGHGEHPGESSLPFEDFASRLYAFHHEPRLAEGGVPIPASLISAVVQRAKGSWAQGLRWVD